MTTRGAQLSLGPAIVRRVGSISGSLLADIALRAGLAAEAPELEHEGCVVSYPYRGAVVLGVSDEEVQEVLIPFRLVLERYSFTKAAQSMADADFAELGKQIWVMGEAARTDDLPRSVEADMRFHELVLSHANQPHTARVWHFIAPRIRAYFFRYGRAADLERIASEHSELLAAMQTRDPETIVTVLERHITVRTPAPT